MISQRSRLVAAVGAMCLLLVSLGCGARSETATPLDEAKQLLFQEKYDRARAKCDEILAGDPTSYDTVLFRGQVNQKDHRIDDAMADFTKAIQLGPTRPDAYSFRYHLYMELAEAEPDRDAKRVLEEAAAADYSKLREYDVSAHIAFQNETRSVPNSLSKPIPGFDPEEELQRDGESLPAENPFEIAENGANANQADPGVTSDPKEKLDADKATDRGSSKTPEKWIADRAGDSDEEQITRLDLNEGTPEEPTLPPHLDPLIQEMSVPPLPHITRFDLQSIPGAPVPFDPNTALAPRSEPERRTTGIKQQPEVPDVPQSQPRGRFFVQNQYGGAGLMLGLPQQMVRGTGIQSGANAGSPFLRGISGNQAAPSGFLPPNAQGSFGPRLGQSPTGRQQEDAEGGPNPPPRRGLRAGTPILTTAIPGTTLIYGTQPNKPKGNRYAPDLSDPKYTPFVPRPTGIQTVPDLPRQ